MSKGSMSPDCIGYIFLKSILGSFNDCKPLPLSLHREEAQMKPEHGLLVACECSASQHHWQSWWEAAWKLSIRYLYRQEDTGRCNAELVTAPGTFPSQQERILQVFF